MKIIHIDSGLGNQMLSYCEYLALKKSNPDDLCYIETAIYEIPECEQVVCQWNGYELERIFDLKTPNIKDVLSSEQWHIFINKITESNFWNKNWNWPIYFTKALNEIGVDVVNIRGDFETKGATLNGKESDTLKSKIKKTTLFNVFEYLKQNMIAESIINKLDFKNQLFIQTNKNIYTGQRLSFRFKNSGIEQIDKEIRASFSFKEFTDKKNLNAQERIKSTNSISIHCRRGDMLSYNVYCYKSGYFKRAVNFIKRTIEHPVFYIFCDSSSISWAHENEKMLGLDFKSDDVTFIDWNKGGDSWRDMQLMSLCKHNIITKSSFGWWGAYLNNNSNKITISPDCRINTTHFF